MPPHTEHPNRYPALDDRLLHCLRADDVLPRRHAVAHQGLVRTPLLD